ncbi:hypothetical protein [Gemmatimonas sp.]|uniref:hypothetical protein n=1 Tax=Gemmatimonas sp. TaxID=1962908 RepID=UPI003563FE3E
MFRLDLLRHHYRLYAEDPWLPIRRATDGELRWPAWEAPVWDLDGSGTTHPDEGDGIASQRIPLALGWSCCFFAASAEVSFGVYDVEDDEGDDDGDDDGDDEGDDARWPLGEALIALFTKPDANPRTTLCDFERECGPDGGSDISYLGVKLFSPNGDGLVTDEEDCFFYEGTPIADKALIATLSKVGQLFQRKGAPDEEPRPLFAKAPVVDYSWQSDGRLTCSWKTTYYAPLTAEPDTKPVFTYQRHTLNVKTEIEGASSHDLVDFAWQYQRMADLEAVIAKAVSEPATHKFLLPIYEQLLFGARQSL